MMEVDRDYPGTALERLQVCRERAAGLSHKELSGDWVGVRKNLLWAAGLKDLPNHAPGEGYTGHCFNDYIHCDATTMLYNVIYNTNDGEVNGIAYDNQLGPGIEAASEGGLGPGGSWCTCMMGCHKDPPADVAHLQFKSRIAFKLVWCAANDYTSFVLVDDYGILLNMGTPSGNLPLLKLRRANYKLVSGSKYARAADEEEERRRSEDSCV